MRSKTLAMALGMAAMGMAYDASIQNDYYYRPSKRVKHNKLSQKEWNKRRAKIKMQKKSRKNNRP